MKNYKNYIIGFALLLFCLLAVWGMGFFTKPDHRMEKVVKEEPFFTVRDRTGEAKLDIPVGALPEGMSMVDVSIVKKETDDGVEYQLLPDGLQLSKPVTVSIDVSSYETNGVLPLLWHISGENQENVELVNDLKIEPNDSGLSEISVSGKISHFSSVRLDVNGFFQVKIKDVSDHLVGETFPVEVEIQKVNDTSEVSSLGKKRTWTLQEEWNLSGNFYSNSGGGVTPGEYKDTPPNTKMSGVKKFPVTKNFTCAKEDTGSISYRAKLSWVQSSPSIVKGDSEEHDITIANSAMIIVSTNLFECKSAQREALLIGGYFFPIDQFHITNQAGFGEVYHAKGNIVSTDGHVKSDPDPDGKGFGLVSEQKIYVEDNGQANWWIKGDKEKKETDDALGEIEEKLDMDDFTSGNIGSKDYDSEDENDEGQDQDDSYSEEFLNSGDSSASGETFRDDLTIVEDDSSADEELKDKEITPSPPIPISTLAKEVEVVDKGCKQTDYRYDGDDRVIRYRCSWIMKYTDGSRLYDCGSKFERPFTAMNGSDGKVHGELFEIEFSQTSSDKRSYFISNRENNDCPEMQGLTTKCGCWGEHSLYVDFELKGGESATMSLIKFNPYYYIYNGGLETLEVTNNLY